MEVYQLDNDIKIHCLKVPGFPNGIQQAFDELEKAVPAGIDRSYYAIAYLDEQNKVVYKAAVTAGDAWDGSKHGYEPFVIPRGQYLSETIKNWRSHLQDIGATFMNMMKDLRVDKNFPSVEWYKNDDEMKCWVRIQVKDKS